MARSLKKAGQGEEALQTFRRLEREPPGRIGSLPSDLLASFESSVLESEWGDRVKALGAAPRLYRDLIDGRWQLEKASYAFYSERVRQMLPSGEDTARSRSIEQRKLALSLAAERYLEKPRRLIFTPDGYWLVLMRSDAAGGMILAEEILRTRLWPTVFSEAEGAEFRYALRAPEGQALFGQVQGARDSLVAKAVLRTEPSLRLDVWPANSTALDESLRRQQNLYVAVLSFVFVLLAFGGYLTVRTLREELRMAQLKSDFVATVSHEFRSPLAGINQLGEMLRDGRVHDLERRQQYYEMIVDETGRLRRLVENVLDFSRMEDGRKQYRFEPFDPAPWLRSIVHDFESAAATGGFRVEAAIPERLPPILGDREALSTAVNNLLDNAVKYSGASTVVELEAVDNGTGLAISIRDRGVGIQEDDKPHVFEKFYRGGGDLAREVKGVGLGLNLVKHVVAAHGGSVDFVSQVGQGSVFTIHLNRES